MVGYPAGSGVTAQHGIADIAKAVKTLVSDLGESVNGIADQYDWKEISYQKAAESLNFLVRNCLSELEGYGVKFYE